MRPPRLREGLHRFIERAVTRADAGRPGHVAVWALILILLAGGAAWRVAASGHSPIGSDLLSLLPGTHEDPLLNTAIGRSRDVFLHGLMIAVEGEDPQTTGATAANAREALAAAGYQSENPGADVDALLSLYRRHRFDLLAPEDRKSFIAHPERRFITALQVGLASPGSPAGTPADAGGFLTRWLASLPRPFPSLMPQNGLLAVPDAPRPAFLLIVTLKHDAFGVAGEESAKRAVALARATVAASCPGCTVTATAPALFSAAERAETKREVTWLSIGSTIVIVLLVLAFFRSLRPLALVVLCVASGIVGGGAITLLAFGSVNLLTVVFGTTLLGISADYALYFLADRRLGRRATGTLRRVVPGLALALMAAVIAFAFLAGTPFAPLRQMALFSIAGLIAAFLTVCALFPFFSRGWGDKPAPATMRWLARAAAIDGRRTRLVVAILLVAGAIGGVVRLRAVDNLSVMQALPPQLVHATGKINRLLGTPPASGFFFVRAPDLATALARERALDAAAAQRQPSLVLLGLAGFLPSPEAQGQARAAWASLLDHDGAALKHALATHGLPTGFANALAADWQEGQSPLRARQLIAAVPALGHFVVEGQGQAGLVVQVYGNVEAGELAALAAAVPGVEYVNALARINAVFTRIRHQATLWVILGYVVTLILLAWRYGPVGGFAALLSPLTAAFVTLGVLGWLGEPLNAFVVVALMLVAGIGGDYALFLREGTAHLDTTRVGVALAAATTLASFGLLGASRIPALHLFGITVAIGIVVAWLVAPLTLELGQRRRT